MLNGRTYIVASPELAVLVQRASSTLSFDELIIEVFVRLVGANADTLRILRDPTAKEEGRTRVISRAHDVINPQLALSRLGDVSEKQLKHFGDFFNNIQNELETRLFDILTRQLTAASMHSFYGPENPFALHPELVDAFWNWERGNVAYMVNILPKITARKAYLGMEACVKGFVEYFENGRHTQACQLLRERMKIHDEAGLPISEQARFEISFVFATSGNAGVATFWIINNIFSRPKLLQAIREEITTNAMISVDTVAYTKLRDSCPLLNSVYRETLRLISPMTSARYVLEDTIIAGRYLLRKYNVVQIAGGVLHADHNIWGPDASSFNPNRFFYSVNGSKTNPDGSTTDNKANTVHPAAFRAFGGGSSLCPGRQFAQMEILSLATFLVLSFEMSPVSGEKSIHWDPPRNDKRFPIAVTKPLRDINVKLRRRADCQHVRWNVAL